MPSAASSKWRVDASHRLGSARHLASPNCDARPADTAIDLLIIHHISLPPEEFGGPWIDQLFLNTLDCAADPYFAQLEGLRVSAHCCIFRDGAVTQYVPFDQRAWHAGQSCYQGRQACNDFAIGIELEGSGLQPFTDAQYESLRQLTLALLARYPELSAEHIVGHSDVAPGRKTDPGPLFDWQRYRASLGS